MKRDFLTNLGTKRKYGNFLQHKLMRRKAKLLFYVGCHLWFSVGGDVFSPINKNDV